jgi:hypothetical protein
VRNLHWNDVTGGMVHSPGPSSRTVGSCSTDQCSGLFSLRQFHRTALCPRARGSATARTLVVRASTKAWDVGCRLAGVGSSVPPGVLSNTDLEQLVETNDEWIRTRTGIRLEAALCNEFYLGLICVLCMETYVLQVVCSYITVTLVMYS